MMNVLQRKMFAEGDVANTSVSEPLIRYYVSQGYNPAEIKAAYPAAPYGLIEQIAMEFGGVVNPGVQGRNSTGYTEDMPQAVTEGQFGSLLNQVPMNETIVTGSPTGNLQPGQISPPSMPIQDDIQMSLGELNDPRFDAVIQGNYMGIPTPEVAGNIDQNLSNDLLNQKIQNLITKRNSLIAELGFPSGEIPELQMLDQEIASLRAQLPSNATAPSLDQQIADLSSVPEVNTTVDIETGLPTEREIAGGSSTGVLSDSTLTVRDKSTNSEYELPRNFIELVNNRTLDGMTLYPIINNTNFEFSPDVKAALENFVKMDEPFSDLIGGGKSFDERRGTARRPEDLGSSAQDVVLGIQNLAAGPIRGIGKFFGQLSGGQAGQEAIEKYLPEGISREELALSRLLQIPGTKYKPPSVLGDTEGSVPLTTDEAIKQLQEQKPAEVISDVRKERLAAEAEAERKATGGTDFSKYAPDLQERLNAELSDTSRITGQPTEQEQENINRIITNQGSFFSSPDWNEFLRNLGLGLSGSADLASGLVKGTALGSQAKALREAEALEAEQEERLEKIKAGAEDSLKPTDIVSLNQMTSELSTNIKDFEGSRASIGIMNDAISLFEEAMSKGVKITGLQGKISRFTDQGKAFFNIDGEVSDSTKIQNYIDQVKQRSIRDILNESGRTISNLDREIVDKVFGEINLTDEPKEILKKLRRARSNLMDSNADKQRVIGTNYSSITNKAYGATGLRTIAPYEVMVQQILNANPSSFGSMQPIQGAVNVDLRGQNIFGNI
jgi:hypothetical protein